MSRRSLARSLALQDWCALGYLSLMFGALCASYMQLREVLPAVNPHSLDAQIYAFDLAVFRYEPALAWDRYITPVTTEWFAFFYYSHFILFSCYMDLYLLIGRDRDRLA